MKKFSLEDSVFLEECESFVLSGNDDHPPFSPPDSLGSVCLSSSEAENGSFDKKNTNRKSYTTNAQNLSNDAELIDTRKLTVPRSRTYDSSLNLDMKNEQKLERKKNSSSQSFKANSHFHKAFKDIPKEETLKETFTCALQKEILYHGKLYISENWICFHSKVFGKDTKIAIPALAVTLIKKTKTALLVPNALIIATVTERFIFVSLLSRDATYKLILSVCSHLENVSTGNSPNPSADHSFRGDRPGSYPLDFNDFSELDGLVSRRKEIEECSSTGSQTAESENSQEFPERERNVLTKSQQTLVETDRPNKQPQEKKCVTQQRPGLQRLDVWKMISLNGLLFFYAILVCLLIFSTFYMQSRIGHLEQQLSSLNSAQNVWPVDPAMLKWHINADGICNELTSNLEKLERIQRNLQQLLEDSD